MITEPKILRKLERIEKQYHRLRFEVVGSISMEMGETRDYLREEPREPDFAWKPVAPGDRWGGDWLTAWFRGDVVLPDRCAGRKVFLRARTGAETMLLVDGMHRGVFDPNHAYRMMALRGEAGRRYHVALEAYSGHTFPGTQPYDERPPVTAGCHSFDGVQIALEREDVSGFVFDLTVLRQLAENLNEHSLRKGKVTAALARVFETVTAVPGEADEATWRSALGRAREVMRPLLEMKNGPTVPQFGIVAHSHIDTAWLWPLAETWRKCARTFSSMLSLMEQYPEVVFLQPAPCHTEVVRNEYPGIFERMRDLVREGRWEPNGAMWVEPDCNLVSGESFVRQLLVGQNVNRELFDYRSDTLWLPDVFGYSAALPQILRGCGVEFFVTTKIGWNDTTRFPYDTFTWQGIDGTDVLAHFNNIHCWPDPATLLGRWQWVQHKDSQERYLLPYGFGDGGGGPQAEMMEVARRVVDLEGCPKAEHTTVTDFMAALRDESSALPVFSGELYLEMHRGTLTSIAAIKKGNRKAEFALRDAELFCTLAALHGAPYPADELIGAWKTLLTNQFHDILPGSSIAEANDEAIADFAAVADQALRLGEQALRGVGLVGSSGDRMLLLNSLSWDRTGPLEIDALPSGETPVAEGITVQPFETAGGEHKVAVSGVTVPALGAVVVELGDAPPLPGPSPFTVCGDTVATPFATVRLASKSGEIVSFMEKSTGRELVRSQGGLNRFLFGEDVPLQYDNWDIDEDQRRKLSACVALESREVVANGPLQLRLRSTYSVGRSQITQDTVFHSDSPRIDFDTCVDWHEKHKVLRAGFELDVLADSARHEIQYGHVQRPTHRNYPQDRARFEVCAHKWTDLSETGFGVALLNDCKYGVDVFGSDVRLTLLKSGTHPDPRGDEGVHCFTYSLLPHACGFSAEAVVRPAYELNVRPTMLPAGPSARGILPPVSIDTANVIIESVKWAEHGKAFVVRLYEAEKTGTATTLRLNAAVVAVEETNMLEEGGSPLPVSDGAVRLEFRPFEIKTLRCCLG